MLSVLGSAGSHPSLTETSSDTVGTINSADRVSITARAKNAKGMRVSQYGDPEYLRFVSHSRHKVPTNDAKISTTYKCIKPGKNILFKLVIYGDEHSTREIIKRVTCKRPSPSLMEVYSDTLGKVGKDDTVSIAAKALNAKGMRVSQYGDPEYLKFVSHSHGTVPRDDAKISTTYKCIKPGKNILLKLVIFRDWPPDHEIIKRVTCKADDVIWEWDAKAKVNNSILDYARIESESDDVFTVKIIHPIIREDGEVTFLEFRPKELNPFTLSAHVKIRYRNCVDNREPENEGMHPLDTPKYSYSDLDYAEM